MSGERLPQVLLDRRNDFLGFLRARLGSAEAAEDALQAAFIKAIDRADTIRDDESAVAWFYRVLRNSLVDAGRKRGVESKALESLGQGEAVDDDLYRAVCQCVGGAVETLKPEYAVLLRRVDLDGAAVPEAAQELGITANNAGVRLHRARAALRDKLKGLCGACARHGCLDCRCRKQPPP